MADVAELDIKIGAHVEQAVTGLNNVQKGLANTAVAAQKFDSALGSINKGSNSATIALSNLGRVAQDAPFGFIAIQNNLNPLLESFQRLQKESGSTATALKSLGASLLSGAGIGLALSVISSLLIKFPNLLSGISEAAAKAAKVQQDYTDAIAASGGALETELTRMSALIQVTRDVGQSTATRTNALQELQRQYPDYLKNLNLENINSLETAKALDKLTEALQRKAKAQAFSNLLTKANEDLIKLSNAPLEENLSLLESLKSTYFGLGSLSESTIRATTKATTNRSKALADQQKIISDLNKQFAELTRQQAEGQDFKFKPTGVKDSAETIAKILADLQKKLSFLNAKELNEGLDQSTQKVGALEEAIQRLIKINVDPNNKLIKRLFGDVTDLQAIIDGLKLNEVFHKLGDKLAAIPVEPKITFTPPKTTFNAERLKLIAEVQALFETVHIKAPINIAALPSTDLDAFKKQITGVLKDLNDATSDIIVGFQTGIFDAVGQGIGDALSGEGFASLFTGVFHVVGEAMKQLGEALIAAAIGLQAIKKAFATLNPVVAAAAGIGLIALGTLIENKIAKIPKFAEGGIATRATLGVFGEAGAEAILPLDRLKDFLKPSNSDIVLSGSFDLRGDLLRAVLKRADNKFGRTF